MGSCKSIIEISGGGGGSGGEDARVGRGRRDPDERGLDFLRTGGVGLVGGPSSSSSGSASGLSGEEAFSSSSSWIPGIPGALAILFTGGDASGLMTGRRARSADGCRSGLLGFE